MTKDSRVFVLAGSTGVGSGSTATASNTRVHVRWNSAGYTTTPFLEAIVPLPVPLAIPLVVSNQSVFQAVLDSVPCPKLPLE